MQTASISLYKTFGLFYFYVSILGVNSTNINSSEFVRQELRAVVNSRNQMSGVRPPQSPLGQGPMQLGNAPNTTMSMGTQQMGNTSMINTTPDPTLGFNFDLPQSGNLTHDAIISYD